MRDDMVGICIPMSSQLFKTETQACAEQRTLLCIPQLRDQRPVSTASYDVIVNNSRRGKL